MSKFRIGVPRRTSVTKVTAVTAAFCALAAMTASSAGASLKPRDTNSVTIGFASPNTVDLPEWIAMQNGYFTAKGVTVKFVNLTAPTINAALVSGSVQFGVESNATLVGSVATGVPVEGIDATAYGIPLGLCISNAFMAAHHLTTKTPWSKVAKALIGSTGGSNATSVTGGISVALQSVGVPLSDVHISLFATQQSMYSAFVAGQVSWFAGGEPTPLQAQAAGYGQVLGTEKTVPGWAPKLQGYGQLVVAAKSWLAANPGTAKAVVQAIEEGSKWLGQHEQKALAIAVANSPGIPPNVLFNSYRILTWPTNGKFNVNKWRTSMAFNIKSGQYPPGTKVIQNVDWTNQYT